MPTPRDADTFAKRSLCRSVPEVLWTTEYDRNFSLVRQTRNSRAVSRPAVLFMGSGAAAGRQKTSRWRRETAGAKELQGPRDCWEQDLKVPPPRYFRTNSPHRARTPPK